MALAERTEALPQPQRENQFKAIIAGLAKVDYEHGTNVFQSERAFFTDLKNNIPETSAPVNVQLNFNPYPTIFESREGFLIFKEFNDNEIIDAYQDYSFIYQKLVADKLIRKLEHKAFMEWLFQEKFVSIKDYQYMMDAGFFRSLSKTSKGSRLNSYFHIKEKYIPRP